MTKFPTRETIAASQLEQLRSLLNTILPDNSFYAKKFSGIKTSVGNLEDFSKRIPFTTKQELVADQQKHPLFGTNLTFPLERYTRFHQTSGTTAAPLRWLDTPESWDWMVENWCKIFRAAGVTARDRIYFAFSFGPFIGFWLAFDAGQKIGALCIPGGGLSSEARLRAILENKSTVLCCTPTYALRLAEIAARDRIKLSSASIKTIVVAGEPGGSIPATRNQLQKLWPRANIFDHHGMTEVGPVTYQCPKRPGLLHVLESGYYAEIIDPDGSPVAPGQPGELILTTLGRTSSPLIRYRTGDLVRSPSSKFRSSKSKTLRCNSQPCACGRFDLALEGGILGRVDDMLIIRGVNVYPSAVEDVLRRFDNIAEFQVEICRTKNLPELKLQIEPKKNCADPKRLATSVQKALQTVFNLRIETIAVPTGTLPRFEMKAKRWIEVA